MRLFLTAALFCCAAAPALAQQSQTGLHARRFHLAIQAPRRRCPGAEQSGWCRGIQRRCSPTSPVSCSTRVSARSRIMPSTPGSVSRTACADIQRRKRSGLREAFPPGIASPRRCQPRASLPTVRCRCRNRWTRPPRGSAPRSRPAAQRALGTEPLTQQLRRACTVFPQALYYAAASRVLKRAMAALPILLWSLRARSGCCWARKAWAMNPCANRPGCGVTSSSIWNPHRPGAGDGR